MNNKPELLAPAGTPDALDAAIEAGADAVYFGSTSFSCRMRAGNFDDTAMREATAKCRAYGVKSYITVNTRLRDGELDGAKRLIDMIAECGADAVIMTDLALAEYVRRSYPTLEMHASTQCAGATAEDAKALAALGFSRMVCPRELSREQIKALAAESPIGIEMFLHGAHCASFSGECLASFAMGGRSGNRGECAQPCRLAYGGMAGDAHPLSIKDMCLAGHITEIADLGVCSLKIEGRQKSADYVYGVTSVYRRLLDEGRNATADEAAHLARLFSRDGFTDGYFRRDYRRMTGVRERADADISRSEASFAGLSRKVPLDMRFTARRGCMSLLAVTAGGITATYAGAVPHDAISQPMTAETAKKNLGKLGQTEYRLAEFDARIDGGLFMTAAELNELRRGAADALAAVFADSARKPRADAPAMPDAAMADGAKRERLLTAEFLSSDGVPDSAFDYFDEIYVPAEEYAALAARLGGRPDCTCKVGVALPPVLTDDGHFPEAEAKNAGLVLANSLGEAARAVRLGCRVTASYRLNVFGKNAANETAALGCASVIASPEAALGAVRAMSAAGNYTAGAVVYGRLPLMHLMRCPQQGNGYCRGIGGYSPNGKKGGGYCIGTLTDRTGAEMMLVGYPDCVNVLYNSVPIYMADRESDLRGIALRHFIFTTESAAEADDVIARYTHGSKAAGSVRRIG